MRRFSSNTAIAKYKSTVPQNIADPLENDENQARTDSLLESNLVYDDLEWLRARPMPRIRTFYGF